MAVRCLRYAGLPIAALLALSDPVHAQHVTETNTLGAPTSTALGGVFANAGTTHRWVSSINTDGTVTVTQPKTGDVSGLILNVKDFGALGNSNGSTGNGADDTTAIQAAVNAAATIAGAHLIYFPPGIYRITASLTEATP